jgi:hypothetical protein
MTSTSFCPRRNGTTTDLRQGHAEARRLGGDPQVAVESQLAASREGVALYHGDGGVARGLDAAQDDRDQALGIGGRRLLLLHFLEVHPRAEGLALAAHDDHAHGAVVVEAIEEGPEAGEDRGVEGVAAIRPVQPDRRHPTINGGENLVGHARSYTIPGTKASRPAS